MVLLQLSAEGSRIYKPLKINNMGRMKEVWQLKQDLIELDPALTDMPDSYFIDVYLFMHLQKHKPAEKDELPSETDFWDGDENDRIQY